jgi:hypothetical protein
MQIILLAMRKKRQKHLFALLIKGDASLDFSCLALTSADCVEKFREMQRNKIRGRL